MRINSNRKGKTGEREFANICKKHGFNEVRRGQQYDGLEGKDIVGLEGLHVEVKRVERLNISKAMKQAERDAKDKEIPVVAHRKNYEDWMITMKARDWFKFYKAWIKNNELEG